jgi:formylglycine-generating enzyme required for sulfatase activity
MLHSDHNSEKGDMIIKKSIQIFLLFFIASYFLFSACSKNSTGPEKVTSTFTLSGRITASLSGLSGVSVHLTSADKDTTVMTTSTASYTFTAVTNGSLTLIPAKTDYIFIPPSITTTVNGEDLVVLNFKAIKSSQIPALVAIPGGTFQMGNAENAAEGMDDEKPVHTVTVSNFEMGVYEITNEQYVRFLNAAMVTGDITPSTIKLLIGGLSVMGAKGTFSGFEYIFLGAHGNYDEPWIKYNNGAFSVEQEKANLPAEYVSWYGAEAFALYYGLDLPTEAEWEYACRGGKQYKYGTDDGTISTSKANYWVNGIGNPATVGSYPKNPYGLYDICGNVKEWCLDWYGDYTSNSQNNPTGAATGSFRVMRDGSYTGIDYYCRSADRTSAHPGYGYKTVGFRVVRR